MVLLQYLGTTGLDELFVIFGAGNAIYLCNCLCVNSGVTSQTFDKQKSANENNMVSFYLKWVDLGGADKKVNGAYAAAIPAKGLTLPLNEGITNF